MGLMETGGDSFYVRIFYIFYAIVVEAASKYNSRKEDSEYELEHKSLVPKAHLDTNL